MIGLQPTGLPSVRLKMMAYLGILMPSLKAVPHLSHLVGLAGPQMITPTAPRRPCSWDEAGVPTANGATSPVASMWPALAVVAQVQVNINIQSMLPTTILPPVSRASDVRVLISLRSGNTVLSKWCRLEFPLQV